MLFLLRQKKSNKYIAYNQIQMILMSMGNIYNNNSFTRKKTYVDYAIPYVFRFTLLS